MMHKVPQGEWSDFSRTAKNTMKHEKMEKERRKDEKREMRRRQEAPPGNP
jgi:hypothetical protein